MPSELFFLLRIWRIMSGNRRNWTNPVSTVKNSPTARAKYAMGFQIASLMLVSMSIIFP